MGSSMVRLCLDVKIWIFSKRPPIFFFFKYSTHSLGKTRYETVLIFQQRDEECCLTLYVNKRLIFSFFFLIVSSDFYLI